MTTQTFDPNGDDNLHIDQSLTGAVTSNQKFGSSYKNRAPVEIGLDVEKLVVSVLETEISIPLRSLAGLLGAIQKETRKQVTKARFLVIQVSITSVTDQPLDDKDTKTNQNIEVRPRIRVESLPLAVYTINKLISDELPEGCVVASHPILQYLSENKNVDLEQLIVARETETLRAVYSRINGVGQEECLLDGGSMIVSMSKKVVIQLGLTWDPSIQIKMERASNYLE